MKNQPLISTLDSLADYYTLLRDIPRVRSFRAAARNLELISFEITLSNLPNVDFKGLGKSLKAIIQELLSTGKVTRLEELKAKLPPISALSLLQLYNFDLELVFHIWDKYQAHTLAQLHSLRDVEPRVQEALDMLGALKLDYVKLPSATYPLLGDLVVQSSFGSGTLTVDAICNVFLERDYKHGFIADFFEGPNVLNGISKDKILQQRQIIKQAQTKYNIRIWQGVVLDADLNGNVPSDVASLVDYVVIKLSTQPHKDVFARVKQALKSLPNALIDVLDKYSPLVLNKEQLLDLANNPLIISTPDYITMSRILDIAQDLPPLHVALASYASNEQQFDNIYLAQDLASRLLYPHSSLINCRPHPFKQSSSYTSAAGVRETHRKDTSENTLTKLEATLQRMQQLQKLSLDQLFQKEKK